MKEIWQKLMRRVVAWLDPRLEKYRARGRARRGEQASARVAAKMGGGAILRPGEDFGGDGGDVRGGGARGDGVRGKGALRGDEVGDRGLEGAKNRGLEGADLSSEKHKYNDGAESLASEHKYDADFERTEAFPRPPRTQEELVLILKRTPKYVLSDDERERIAAAMSFRSEKIRDLVLPKSQITFVRDTDMMGPLMLDKLYKSGFSHFPVLDKNDQVVGILHTSALNALEVKQTTIAAELLDEAVYYLRDDYTVEQALAAFMRTNSFFCLVVNRNGNLRGLLTFRMLMEHLLGELVEEEFEADGRLAEVLRRKL